MPRLSSLPMYDLPELSNPHDNLWGFVAARLAGAGVCDVPAALNRTMAYDQTWIDPTLLLGQSCGLPVVEQLDGLVAVLGGFCVDDGYNDGSYTSKLVVHRDSEAQSLGDLAWSSGVRAGINGWDSLSGCVSLGVACAEALQKGLVPSSAAFVSVAQTGGHVHSAVALADRSIDLACLDGHTLALLQRHRPDAVAHLRVIASGPVVPCLPLITALSANDELIAVLRSTLCAVAEDESLAVTRDALGITGFAVFANDRCDPIRTMRQTAKSFFDRRAD
jgi:ABC-type phosphate/phosphonate transport system substrate-binding protein